MSITRTEVERIAELARLEIPAEGIERMTTELTAVLAFVATLDRLDLSGCEPSTFAPAGAGLRADVPDADRQLDPSRATAAAPASENGFFLVPPIVENVNP
ncbi:MAG: Asp-tRNA(Asn)/Glu-tRNA(Gln) amidotransferase subunit GatC [Candidatus Eisenbacteria bacterium]|uniref:Aspartyl/glutamyl-tRNA(Asn/Gln) amidotransferase subunit C n=1 Tax=Eiseniibacteriota bacterium TaxID=2212470 RepID=A0A849T1H6_UNCEI|nr:Asp-tRNA(Asn)/Glu-tRNA(Gln) amidotransferase subunit GatC [Candidatus Eisenbacteria bacterium]